MPAGNQTGPEGKGPMTGRKMGICAGNNESFQTGVFGGVRRFFGGRGNGFGQSFRGGRRNRYFSQNNIQETASLQNEIEMLKKHLAELEERVKDEK